MHHPSVNGPSRSTAPAVKLWPNKMLTYTGQNATIAFLGKTRRTTLQIQAKYKYATSNNIHKVTSVSIYKILRFFLEIRIIRKKSGVLAI